MTKKQYQRAEEIIPVNGFNNVDGPCEIVCKHFSTISNWTTTNVQYTLEQLH